jgi:hypothetical protein
MPHTRQFQFVIHYRDRSTQLPYTMRCTVNDPQLHTRMLKHAGGFNEEMDRLWRGLGYDFLDCELIEEMPVAVERRRSPRLEPELQGQKPDTCSQK